MALRHKDIDGYEEEESSEVHSVRSTLTRGEMTGIILAAAVLLYGVIAADVPVVFLAVSFLGFMSCRFFTYNGRPWGRFVGNVLQWFSLVLLAGAFILLFK
jgi:hypothetical protein